MMIDADSHIFPREAMNVAREVGFEPFVDNSGREWCRTPNGSVREWGSMYYDKETRLSALKEAGFERQILICDQGYVPDFVSLDVSKKICHAFNDSVAEIQHNNEEFLGIADVPHQDVAAALAEARRSINELKLKGIRIYGTWSGKNFESEEWWPFFELVEELGVPLFFHTHGTAGLGKFNPNLIGYDRLTRLSNVKTPQGDFKPLFVLGNGIGSGMEAICLVSGLIFSGTLKQFPNLRIAMLECGVGLAPWIASRLDMLMDFAKAMQAQKPDIYGTWLPFSTKPSEYVKKHFWWAIDNFHEVTIPILVKEAGMGKRLLAQTDFPHPEGCLDVRKWIEQTDISESDKEAILGSNAADLLKL